MARQCSIWGFIFLLILSIFLISNGESVTESSKTLTTATEEGFRINKFELVNTSTTEISIVSSIPVSGHPILLVNATSTVTLMCTFEGNPKLQFRIRHKETNKIYPDSPTLQQASGNYTISVIHAFSCEDSGEYICENAKVSCNNSCKRIILVTPCKPVLLNKEIGYKNSKLNVNVLLMSYPPVNSAQVFVKGEQTNESSIIKNRNWFSNIQHLSSVKMSLNLSKFNMPGEIILELCNPEGCLDVFQTINNREIDSSTPKLPVIIGIISSVVLLTIVSVIIIAIIFPKRRAEKLKNQLANSSGMQTTNEEGSERYTSPEGLIYVTVTHVDGGEKKKPFKTLKQRDNQVNYCDVDFDTTGKLLITQEKCESVYRNAEINTNSKTAMEPGNVVREKREITTAPPLDHAKEKGLSVPEGEDNTLKSNMIDLFENKNTETETLCANEKRNGAEEKRKEKRITLPGGESTIDLLLGRNAETGALKSNQEGFPGNQLQWETSTEYMNTTGIFFLPDYTNENISEV